MCTGPWQRCPPTLAPVRGLWLGHTGPLGQAGVGGGQEPVPGLQSVPLSKKRGCLGGTTTGGGGQAGVAGSGWPETSPLSGTSLSWEANWRAGGDSGCPGLWSPTEKIK
ncbi:hypothetical protein I79_013851 [Cricetulus griseus]|uniref:Uncharacterized protein n=1 Tax=Cricetulus griseus TaxID=10029 RepID=G3HSL7_CRIGR|nr:hypothetical protein I79_013851 [Cricetulus griseus]